MSWDPLESRKLILEKCPDRHKMLYMWVQRGLITLKEFKELQEYL